MTMTRSTPDQLIKIIVAALKLQQRGTCGMWRVESGKCRTDVHPLVMRHASATQIIGKLCGRRAVFPGFSTTAAMSAKLVAREQQEELKWSRHRGAEGRGGKGGCSSSLCRPSTSAA